MPRSQRQRRRRVPFPHVELAVSVPQQESPRLKGQWANREQRSKLRETDREKHISDAEFFCKGLFITIPPACKLPEGRTLIGWRLVSVPRYTAAIPINNPLRPPMNSHVATPDGLKSLHVRSAATITIRLIQRLRLMAASLLKIIRACRRQRRINGRYTCHGAKGTYLGTMTSITTPPSSWLPAYPSTAARGMLPCGTSEPASTLTVTIVC
jgi:hypothetical protein